mmetsp:Transcript_22021/g.71187  ORF Transcript_22021/g.71187 Transcript_22021/m.71187 type:complete len:342 (+) Transcript_22021:870-1895(+)
MVVVAYHGPKAGLFIQRYLVPGLAFGAFVQTYGQLILLTRLIYRDTLAVNLMGKPKGGLWAIGTGTSWFNFGVTCNTLTITYLSACGIADAILAQGNSSSGGSTQATRRTLMMRIGSVMYMFGNLSMLMGLSFVTMDARIEGTFALVFITMSGVPWLALAAILGFLDSSDHGSKLTNLLWKSHGRKKQHFFVSHYQKHGGDQAHILHNELTGRGLKVWWDMRLDGDITEEAMKKGVAESLVVLLFLADETLMRPFVQLELRTALAEGVPIMIVHEEDPRHGAATTADGAFASFGAYIGQCPQDLRSIFDKSESIAYRRRAHEADAMYGAIIDRLEHLCKKM